MELWSVEMRRKEYDALWMFLRFLHSCNLFRTVKITNTYSTSMHLWNHVTWYTRWPKYVDLNRDAWYPEPALVSAAFCTLSEPESMSESHMSVTFIAAGIVRSCQSTLVRAMLIRAGIVRDHVRATLVKATLSEPELSETISECTFIARIVRHYFRATLVRAKLIRPGLSDHIWIPPVTVEWRWIPGSIAVPISWERYWSSQDGLLLLTYKSNQNIPSRCTVPLVDEHVLSVRSLHANKLSDSNCNLRPC